MDFYKKFISPTIIAVLPRLISFLLIAVIGLWLVNFIIKIFSKFLKRFNLDYSLSLFICRALKITLQIFVIISAMTALGIPTTSLITALGAAAVGISLALKDSLSNIAGGILILFSRPLSTRDHVEINGLEGIVYKVDIIHTVIRTFDNRHIIIPNGQVINEKIINFSREDKRRLELIFPISYSSDVEKAKSIILRVIENNKLSLLEPAPIIRVHSFDLNSIRLVVRVWCKNENYTSLLFDLNEQVKTALHRAKRNKYKVAVMFLDLDSFKSINDNYGHRVGDLLLKGVGQRISGILRREDILARLGGDEFAVLLPQITTADDAGVVSEKICLEIRKPWSISGHSFTTTLSIGIAIYPQDGESGEELLINADRAMYNAKLSRKDNYRFYSAGD